MANIVEMPKLGFDMAEGTLVKWVKAENEKVSKGEVLAEIETDKATVEVESTYSGVVYKQLVAENSTLPVGTPIAVIAEEGEVVDLDKLLSQASEKQLEAETEEKSANAPALEKETDITASVVEKEGEIFKASPLAKRMADEKALDLNRIDGTGPGGRIVKRDVEKVLESGKPAKTTSETKVISGEDKTIEISRLRAAIGKRMLESRQSIPDFYVTYNYNAGSLMQMRKGMNLELPKEDKFSINDFIIRAVALALRDFPNLNASLSGRELTRYSNINIGSAVAVENGLLTVVVRNADQKSLVQISQEMQEMVARVKEGKVRSEDVEGSTFTISNLGMFGVEDFVAIINPPEAAILAIGGALQAPVIQNGQVIIGWQMKATISADHRITDGAEAARFMQHLATFLEQPWRLVQ